MSKRILVVCNQHGNELLGSQLEEHLKSKNSQLLRSVDFYDANPRAKELGIRYVDSDMNRSYTTATKPNYEQRRAAALLQVVQEYDLVLDMHTTRCNQPPSIIATDNNLASGEVKAFIRASSIKHIVEMSDDIAGGSLIGRVGRSISIEVEDSSVGDRLLHDLEAAMQDYTSGLESQATLTRHKYLIDGGIPKTPPNLKAELINFEKHPDLGFYPVLAGENSYRNDPNYKYLGFRAERRISGPI